MGIAGINSKQQAFDTLMNAVNTPASQAGPMQQLFSKTNSLQSLVWDLIKMLKQLERGGGQPSPRTDDFGGHGGGLGGELPPTPSPSPQSGSGPDIPPASGGAPGPVSSGAGGALGPNIPSALKPYEQLIHQASAQTGVPASLIGAQIMQESGGNPNAMSTNPALGLPDVGLGQMDVATYQGLQKQYPNILPPPGNNPVATLQNPATNIMASALYMKGLLAQNNGNIPAALTSYNGGADPNYIREVTSKMNALQSGAQPPGGW